MSDGLFDRGFSEKCKSLIKVTRTRLDAIKSKRNAMLKYLEKDVAELLSDGLDINAYGRAEALYNELNLSSCYDTVEQCCELIQVYLSVIQKQRECPAECREAISSLMFAAARFADLPELRDLRDTFTERFGKSLEPFVNKELVEKLASKPPSERTLELMRFIAQEFSIKWDSKAFQQKLASPLPTTRDQPKTYGTANEPKIDEKKLYNRVDESAHERNNVDVPSNGRRVVPNEDTTLNMDDHPMVLSNGRRDDDIRKPLPPPYLKPNTPRYAAFESNIPPADTERNHNEEKVIGASKVNGHNNLEHQDVEKKPKPKSVRTRHMRPPPRDDNEGDEADVSRIPSARRREEKQGLQHALDGDRSTSKDEEERMMDKYLLPYSKKPTAFEPRDVREGRVNAKVSHHDDIDDAGEPQHRHSRKHKNPEPPSRATSLPPDPVAPTESERGPARANSFQLDMYNAGGHVHPRLPDFDDIHARFAALKGRFDNSAVDRITNLPAPLRSHIVSFLRIDDALRSSILSRRWKAVCDSLLNMAFDESEFDKQDRRDGEFLSFLQDMLLLHDGSMVRKLSIKTTRSDKDITTRFIDSLIRYAKLHKVENFELHLRSHPRMYLPFDFSSVIRLSLSAVEINMPSGVHFPALMYLELHLVNFHNDASQLFLCSESCPALRSLSLFFCAMNAEYFTVSIPTLKSLKFVHCDPTCIDISVNSIERIACEFTTVPSFIFQDASTLTDGIFNILGELSSEDVSFLSGNRYAGKILRNLHTVVRLTLGVRFLEILYADEYLQSALRSLNIRSLRCLHLQFFPSGIHLHIVVSLLRSYCNLQILRVSVVGPDVQDRGGFLRTVQNIDEWDSTDLSDGACFDHLKSVRFDGFTESLIEIRLVKYILQHAPVLETMQMTCAQFLTEDYAGEALRVKLLITQFTRAAPLAKIIVLSSPSPHMEFTICGGAEEEHWGW